MTVAPIVPTLFLPPLKSLRSQDHTHLLHVFDKLRATYCPPIHGFAHAAKHASHLYDAFEKSYAVKWLTSVVALYSGVEDMEEIVHAAASALAIFSGSSAQGTVVRVIRFPSSDGDNQIDVTLEDAPLETDPSGSNVGLQTWGSSYVLADKLVRDRRYIFGLENSIRVLELGAGTGLVSVVVGKMLSAGSTFWATDFHPAVLKNLRANILRNAVDGRVEVRALDWRNFIDGNTSDIAPFDVIVAADVVYEAEQCSWLTSCVSSLLRRPREGVPSGVFHLVVPVRPTHGVESELVVSTFPPYDPRMTYDLPVLVSRGMTELHADAAFTSSASSVSYRYYTIVWSR